MYRKCDEACAMGPPVGWCHIAAIDRRPQRIGRQCTGPYQAHMLLGGKATFKSSFSRPFPSTYHIQIRHFLRVRNLESNCNELNCRHTFHFRNETHHHYTSLNKLKTCSELINTVTVKSNGIPFKSQANSPSSVNLRVYPRAHS